MTTPSPLTTQILALSDAGRYPADIARSIRWTDTDGSARTGASLTYVYRVLRTHRPDRPRAPRAATTDSARRIKGLASREIKRTRIAELCGVSRAYVHKVLAAL
jgi:hypothetical protein